VLDEAAGRQQIPGSSFTQGFVVLPAIVVVVLGILLYLSATLAGGEPPSG
jgi:hypothetical protein